MSFVERVYRRQEDCHGVDDWLWVVNETGVWDGPKADWVEHSKLWLSHVKQRRTIVQAGGALGMYPRLFSKIFQTVYTFEPCPLNFHCLVNNNQLDNVIKINAALGDEHKMIELDRRQATNVGMHQVKAGAKGHYPMLMLDDFVFDNLDMIQLDVECYEINVLKGAQKTIEKHLPVITCENGNQRIIEFLAQFGYREVGKTHSDTCFVSSRMP